VATASSWRHVRGATPADKPMRGAPNHTGARPTAPRRSPPPTTAEGASVKAWVRQTAPNTPTQRPLSKRMLDWARRPADGWMSSRTTNAGPTANRESSRWAGAGREVSVGDTIGSTGPTGGAGDGAGVGAAEAEGARSTATRGAGATATGTGATIGAGMTAGGGATGCSKLTTNQANSSRALASVGTGTRALRWPPSRSRTSMRHPSETLTTRAPSPAPGAPASNPAIISASLQSSAF
jgi:hypothetical protein